MDVETSAEMPGSCLRGSGRNLQELKSCEHQTPTTIRIPSTETSLIEAMLERQNMLKAYEQVVKNKGSAGVDGMTTKDLKSHLQSHWKQLKDELLSGRYKPNPIREVEIPKPGRGGRESLAFLR